MAALSKAEGHDSWKVGRKSMNFQKKLNNIIKKNNSLVCIGLDVDIDKLPKHLLEKNDPIFKFNKEIINKTHDLVCTYKPNIAFYEAHGIEGLESLKKTINYLRSNYPEVPILLDAKRGDIGNTAAMYAKSIYEYWDVDATTVYPYLGLDAVSPFLKYKDKCTILLIKKSNPDSKMFQDKKVINGTSSDPFYYAMAKEIKTWNLGNIGLFVGATYPEELKNVRELFPDYPFLTAGIGAQSGETEKAVKAGIDKNGRNLICNNSRSIIYASSNKDFAEKARVKAIEMKDEINKFRK